MVSCLASVKYTMIADVLDISTTIDPDTNESLRQWNKVREIRCQVYPYLEGGIRGAGSGEDFGDIYNNRDYARVKAAGPLNKRQRLTNIRDAASGIVLWIDDETTNLPTVFNVDGAAPQINPVSGRPFEWIMTLSRAEVRK